MIGFYTFIFFAAWCIGIAGWFLGISEIVGIWQFWPRVFAIGIRVLRETQMLPLPVNAVGSKFETIQGVFKVVVPHLCLFRASMHPDWSQSRTNLFIKGSLRWDEDGQATVEGRIPLSPTLFIAAWLEGWAAGAVIVVIKGHLVLGLGTFFMGWVPAVGTCFFAVRSEIRRVRQLVKEYQDLIASQTSNEPEPREDHGNW